MLNATDIDSRAGEDNPPEPVALIEAMRSIGYTPPTAVADLVDNSISADAKSITVVLEPARPPVHTGYLTVEDDGRGMSLDELVRAMKWGGVGPQSRRGSKDLGRFGLGMKTASLSIGSTLTVASRAAAGSALSIRCWDMEHVARAGWRMLDEPHPSAAQLVEKSQLAMNPKRTGTVIVVTNLDRLNASTNADRTTNQTAIAATTRVARHLGMVFHRFIDKGISITVGQTGVRSWNPFHDGELKTSEKLGEDCVVRSFVLPHPSRQTFASSEALKGPHGWLKHQGFHVYRADRLIVPGGWLRLFNSEDVYRLARISIDLPNSADADWQLNVMKSSLSPPPVLRADLERIGDAVRRQAKSVFGLRGTRQAPQQSLDDEHHGAFWNQTVLPDHVKFTINRSHPLVQALKHNIRDSKSAERFLQTFERLLPLDAILQDPVRTVNGAKWEPTESDLESLTALAQDAISLLVKQGIPRATATTRVLSAEPFLSEAEQLKSRIR